MVPFYESTTAPFEETRYIISNRPVRNNGSTEPFRGMFNLCSSMFDYSFVEMSDCGYNTNKPKGEYRRFDNRHECRKERSLDRKKSKPSNRRHKFSK